MLMILIFASCKDENAFMPGDDGQPCYSILVSAPNNSTRATYKEDGENIAVVWEKGDVICVGSNQFVYKEMQGTNGLFFHYGDLTGDMTKATFGISVDGEASQTQSKNNHCREVLEGNVPADYVFTPGDAKKEVIHLLPAQNMSLLHIQTKSPAMFLGGSLLEIKGLDKDYSITLGRDNSLVFADKGDSLDIYVVVPADKSISGGKTLKFYFYSYEKGYDIKDGDEYHYYMKCNTSISTKNDEVVKLTLPNKPTHAAIQMGFDSKMKWATTNVGASSETDYGKYFWWADVVGYVASTTYNFSSTAATGHATYDVPAFDLMAQGYIEARDTKGAPVYFIDCNLTSSKDAATQNWGTDWRMPTREDFAELKANCDIAWTTSINGCVLTSKKNGKSIFLPAGGYRKSTGTSLSESTTNGYYLSSSLSKKGSKYVYGINFKNTNELIDKEDRLRYEGMPVRPVMARYKAEVASDIEGTLPGEFSVSASKKIKFSKGNLQYQASTGIWRFAEHQYDIVGLEGNRQISENNAGWIDLFGWGTSGLAESGVTAYQPWSTSMNNSDYYVGGAYNKGLSGKADWGYNAISNGGNETGKWRSLSKDEWNYLICRTNNQIRKDASGNKLVTKATVNGHPGALLFPDGWTTPSDITIEMNYSLDFTKNTYSQKQFEYLEFLGVVFMPATGYREGTVVNQLGEYDELTSQYKRITGTYWTCSCSEGKDKTQKDDTGIYACNLCIKSDQKNGVFGDINKGEVGNYKRGGGNAVRLAHDVQ